MALGLIFAGQIQQLQARFCDAFFSTPQNGADPFHPSLDMANLTKQGYLHVFGTARIACIFQQSG